MGAHLCIKADKEEFSTPKEERPAVFDPKLIYYDKDGNLRLGATERHRDEEILKLLALDWSEDLVSPNGSALSAITNTLQCCEQDPSKIWAIIPTLWTRQWLMYAKLRHEKDPGPVNNNVMLTPNEFGGLRPRNTLKPADPTVDFPGHYRRVSMDVWAEILALYPESGPLVAVWGTPYDDLSRWRVFRDNLLVEAELPPPVLPEEEEGGNPDGKEKTKDKSGAKK